VEADGYGLSCGLYIERNPLAAQMESGPWRYRWSSCRHCALGESDPLLAVNPWYEQLAREPSHCQALWRAFVLGEDPKEVVVRREDWVIGDARFRQQMQQQEARRDGKSMRLSWTDGTFMLWSFEGLVPGNYVLRLTYENVREGFWTGQAATDAAFELAARKAKANNGQAEGKDSRR
jgi:hypothetical protein